ncbi:MAG: hypothetical protein WCD76_18340, partial [Pyrinomonadaceae bacterium]
MASCDNSARRVAICESEGRVVRATGARTLDLSRRDTGPDFANSRVEVALPELKMTTAAHNIRTTLEMIKIEHTLFALPFAFLGAVLAARGLPSVWQLVWITLA